MSIFLEEGNDIEQNNPYHEPDLKPTGDDGEMTGHPLMFYLSGKDIKSVRFSCKNQKIDFRDRTEKRDEYGEARNFTVEYGKMKTTTVI